MLVSVSFCTTSCHSTGLIPYGMNDHMSQSLGYSISLIKVNDKKEYLHNAQSSPGYLHVGHVPSNCTRHIPQTSSSGISQRHEATAFHSLMVTFMTAWRRGSRLSKQ